MNVIENMHEVRFTIIFIISHIIYYISLITIIIALAIKAVRSDNLSVTYLQRIIVISKIKYKYFYLDFLLFYFIILGFYIILYYFIILKNVLLHVWRCEKKNTVTLNWFHVLNMFKKFPRLKSFTAVFWHTKKQHSL